MKPNFDLSIKLKPDIITQYQFMALLPHDVFDSLCYKVEILTLLVVK